MFHHIGQQLALTQVKPEFSRFMGGGTSASLFGGGDGASGGGGGSVSNVFNLNIGDLALPLDLTTQVAVAVQDEVLRGINKNTGNNIASDAGLGLG